MKHAMMALMIVGVAALVPAPSVQGTTNLDPCPSLQATGIDNGSDPDGCDVECHELPPLIVNLDCARDLPDLPPVGSCEDSPGITYASREICSSSLEGFEVCEVKFVKERGSCPQGEIKPACAKSEDDGGWGGTKVKCDFTCLEADLLAIHVIALDDEWGEAEAYGDVDCGGAAALCEYYVQKSECYGGDGPTTRDGEGECFGGSNEAFDDPVMIKCYTVGLSTICAMAGINCDDPVSSQASMASVCGLNRIPAAVAELLLMAIPPEFSSLVMFASLPSGEWILEAQVISGSLVCETAALSS